MLIPDVPIADYVADRVEIADGVRPPSLSSGLANLLLTRSPRHAWYSHPRLNPAWSPDSDARFDLGSACHAMLLEDKLSMLAVIQADDFRTKAAKAARDDARAAGKIPVLAEQAEAITRMVMVAREVIAQSPDLEDIGPLLPERTILWRHDDERTYLRCRPDWVTANHSLVVSYKTTGVAEPEAFMRGPLLGHGYDLQAAFELAGVKDSTGVDAHYVYLAQEIAPPYACSLIGLSPEWLEFARSKFHKAVTLWAACMAADEWPSYPNRVAYMDLPPWAQAKFLEQHGYEPQPVHDDGRPLTEQLFEKGIMLP